jgi:hypothetical protein
VKMAGLSYRVPREDWRGGSPVMVGWSYLDDRRAGLVVRLGTRGFGFAVIPKMRTT